MSNAGSTAPVGTAITPPTGAAHAQILATGAYRPRRIVTNDEICQHIDSSDEWIRERSGIVTRRFAGPDESVIDMAERAAQQAIDRAGLTGADIDAVLLATISHPYQLPSAASLVAHRIGATPAAALDVSAACAGFCYAVGLATDMVRGGSASTVLVVGVEKLSDLTDPTDRSTAFLFADGAGAVVIGGSSTPGIGPTIWGSDGSQWDAITQTRPWIPDPAAVAATGSDEELDADAATDTAARPYLTMAGQRVFRWAVWQMAPIAQKALDAAGVPAAELAAFVPHQANARIIDAMARQLGLPAHVPVARDVVDAGNTSAASVPLALDRMLTEGEAQPGGLALLIGFGAGLTYAAQVVRLPQSVPASATN